MTEIVHRPGPTLVVQRFRVRRRAAHRHLLLGVALLALVIATWITVAAIGTPRDDDGGAAVWFYLLFLALLVWAALRRASYTIAVSVAGVGFTGGRGHRWFPWERVDRFATQWQELDDQPQRRVLVVLRDELPQPLNPGFSPRPMTRTEVDEVARWLNEWVAYQRDPALTPIPRLPETRP
jgi:hypothetical protein